MLLKVARPALIMSLVLGWLPVWASAQTTDGIYAPNEPALASKEGRILRALRVTGEPPLVDGRLDDDAWRLAQTADRFVQWDPDNGEPMTEDTRVQIAYDDRYLFVAVHCLDRTPADIARGLGRRDEQLPTDFVAIGFDPRHDHQTGYTFMVNPSGVQRDMSFYDDENADPDYNAVWEVRTSIVDTGWVAEYRIPFSQMRFTAAPQPGQVWGFSGRRTIRRRSESGEWVSRPRGERGIISRWGHLVFEAALAPPRRIEVQPYVLASTTQFPAANDDFGGSVGVDARIGLGSAATLSGTVNPDFGQVEQDPAVLNLTVFETFFPEKRPFFLEDSRTFVPPYGLFQLFHSRRIGRSPGRLAVSKDETVLDRPDLTTILGAAKLTGKGRGWTYGALGAMTAREFARVSTSAGGGDGDRLIEPLTSYNVVRLQRDVRNGSNIGAIGTAAVRERDIDAFAGGVDYNLRWDRNRVNWNGHWAVTRAPVDGAAETGAGGVTNFGFGRKHGGFNAHFDHFSPKFRVDDLGFFRSRPDRTAFDVNASVEQPDPWKAFRRIEAVVITGQAWNGDGLRLARFAAANVFTQFRNYWVLEAGVNHDFETLDDLDTRGGPPIVVPARTRGFLGVGSDNRKTWRVFVGGNAESDAAGGWGARIGPNVNVQPSTRLQAAFSVNYSFGRDAAQWIASRDATGDGIVDYVYGTLRRDVVDVTVRSTYAIHRDLTVQMFLQPFVAVGDFSNTRRLARPRSYEFEPVTLDTNPDFHRRSLRGNVVMRWEYLRGSTMFVAWNLSATDEGEAGRFRGVRDLRRAFGAPATHAVLVKVSYWLSR